MRAAPLQLILLLVAVVGLVAGQIAIGQQEGAGVEGRVIVMKVTCEKVNGTTKVNLLLQLPNPGYRITGVEKILDGTTLLVNLTVTPPAGPVIQVIEYRGIALNITGIVEEVVVLVNNTKVYSGSCTIGTEEGQQAGKTGETRDTGQEEHTPQEAGMRETWQRPKAGPTSPTEDTASQGGVEDLAGSGDGSSLSIGLVIAGSILAAAGAILVVRR